MRHARTLVLESFAFSTRPVLLFAAIALAKSRYEKRSIIVTSNRRFTEWDKIFSDSVLATAVLDRLLRHSSIVNIRGKSYRLKGKRKKVMKSLVFD